MYTSKLNEINLLNTPLLWDSFLFKTRNIITMMSSDDIRSKTGSLLYRHMTSTSHHTQTFMQHNFSRTNPYTHIYQKQVYNSLQPEVYIAHTHTQKGYGLFAYKHFKSEEFIGVYTGEILTLFESMLEEFQTQQQNLYILHLTENIQIETDEDIKKNALSLVVSAKYKGGYCRFINHSQTPNCDIILYHDMCVPTPVIQVKKGHIISPHEELTFHYGHTYANALKNTASYPTSIGHQQKDLPNVPPTTE